MSRPPKLYLDEHMGPEVAEQLRRHGFDVLSTQEAGMNGASDQRQMAYAVSQQRALLTFDVADYMQLYEEYLAAKREHCGLIFSKRVPPDLVRHRLMRLLSVVSADDLKNQFRWLNDFR